MGLRPSSPLPTSPSLPRFLAHLRALHGVVRGRVLVEHDRGVRVWPEGEVGHDGHHPLRREVPLIHVLMDQLKEGKGRQGEKEEGNDRREELNREANAVRSMSDFN